MEDVKERAKGFEKELKVLMDKYKVLGFCCDWNTMSVGFDDGSKYGEWFDLQGAGDGTTSNITFGLED